MEEYSENFMEGKEGGKLGEKKATFRHSVLSRVCDLLDSRIIPFNLYVPVKKNLVFLEASGGNGSGNSGVAFRR